MFVWYHRLCIGFGKCWKRSRGLICWESSLGGIVCVGKVGCRCLSYFVAVRECLVVLVALGFSVG